jgi:tetratricopeptide (TPR) repeat protein/TolB-like protein
MTRAAALLVAGVTLGAVFPPAAAAQEPAAAPIRVLVMPFENVKGTRSIVWLGEGASVLLTDDLAALGRSAITRAERRQAFDRLQVPPSAVLTNATALRVGQLVGAARVVIGTVQLDGEQLVAHARSVALETGRIEANVTERGPVADMFAIFERVAAGLVGRPGAAAAALKVDRPSVAAFESFVKGVLAETPGTSIKYLNAALASYPRYDRVRLALWEAYVDQGDHARALAAVQPVPASSSWARRARFLAGVSQINLQKYDDAFATYKALADQQPTAPVLNNLGVVQLRRGGDQTTGLPTFYFDRAAQADPDDPQYYFNLGYAYMVTRDLQAAMYWLREVVRRDPADGDAHFVLGSALARSGNDAEAAREIDLARKLSSTYEEWLKRPAAEQVPKGLERIKNAEVELPHASQIESKITQTSQRDQQELAAFYLDHARRLADQENDRDALAELDRALYLSPYLAEAHLLRGRIHLRNGRAPEAIEALKISLWSAETAEAHTVLAEAYVETKDRTAAREEAERALMMDPKSAAAKRLVAMLKSP